MNTTDQCEAPGQFGGMSLVPLRILGRRSPRMVSGARMKRVLGGETLKFTHRKILHGGTSSAMAVTGWKKRVAHVGGSEAALSVPRKGQRYNLDHGAVEAVPTTFPLAALLSQTLDYPNYIRRAR